MGTLARKYMDEGNLVPDEVVIGMVDDKISSTPHTKGFIFDGFPRTVNQAEALDALLSKKEASINGMLMLEVPNEELVKRLLLRGETSGRTDDQDESKIQNRLNVYRDETLPVAGVKIHFAANAIGIRCFYLHPPQKSLRLCHRATS